jgi:hypothetical protein
VAESGTEGEPVGPRFLFSGFSPETKSRSIFLSSPSTPRSCTESFRSFSRIDGRRRHPQSRPAALDPPRPEAALHGQPERHHGHSAITFWIQAPPELSLFSIHCTRPPHDHIPRNSDFKVSPHVVGADGPFVLLRAVLYAASEYFLYRAGSPPSLKRIPTPDELGEELADVLEVREWGILDRGGGHCLLAALDDAPSSESDGGYRLRVYSSETRSWTTMTH